MAGIQLQSTFNLFFMTIFVRNWGLGSESSGIHDTSCTYSCNLVESTLTWLPNAQNNLILFREGWLKPWAVNLFRETNSVHSMGRTHCLKLNKRKRLSVVDRQQLTSVKHTHIYAVVAMLPMFTPDVACNPRSFVAIVYCCVRNE
jgi:hypothetical protein